MKNTIGSIELSGHIFSSFQVQMALYAIIGLIAVLVIFLLARVVSSKKNSGGEKLVEQPPLPKFEEIFEIESEVFETNPYKNDPDAYLEAPILRTATLTLLVGLRAHLVKLAKQSESASDQHKSMVAIADTLEAQEITAIAFTQWNQSPIQGIAARIILQGKSRTVLFGPSVAMSKATSKFSDEISTSVANAHAAGHIVFVLAIDGLAYGVFSVSHRLQEI
jgi:hypothetical protein